MSEASERETLLPCPFCGGEPSADRFYAAGVYFGCNRCDVWRLGAAEWNRRSPAPAAQSDDARDAARYRWIRENHAWRLLVFFPSPRPYFNATKVFDEAVDAAMSAALKEPK